MAQYFTNFGEFDATTDLDDCSGWSAASGPSLGYWFGNRIAADAGATGGKVCAIAAGVGVAAGIPTDILNDADLANQEIVVRWKLDNWTGVYAGIKVRHTNGGESGGYYLGVYPVWPGQLVLMRSSGGVALLGGPGPYLPTDTWIWMRVRINGSALKAKYWADGDPEPESWTYEVTDATLASGLPLWMSRVSDYGASGAVDVVGYGTNGDTAPTEGGGAGVLPLNAFWHGL